MSWIYDEFSAWVQPKEERKRVKGEEREIGERGERKYI